MRILILERILNQRRRRKLIHETETRPWRPVRRKTPAEPPVDPTTSVRAAEDQDSKGLKLRERRRKRRDLRNRRRKSPRLTFLNIN
jgi:hypothetical protein